MGHNEPIGRGAQGDGGRASEIPDKLYFRIGEVARLCEVPAYVLRFWEGEFPQLKPNKGGTGQRLYRRRDVEMALRVKGLLYDEGYTIPGARQLLKSELKQRPPQLSLLGAEPSDSGKLRGLRRELEAVAAMLSRPVGGVAAGQKGQAKTVHPMRSQRGAAMRAAGGATPMHGAGGLKRVQADDSLFEGASGSNSDVEPG